MPESGSETKKKYAKILPVLHVMPPVLIGILALVYFRLCILTTGGLGGYFLPSAGIIAVLFAAVLNKKRLPDILGWIFYAAVPFLHFILLEAIQQHTRDMVQKMVWLNLIVYCLASWFVLFLLRKHGGTAVLITTVLAWFSATANSVCWQFRSLPILPWDIYSIKTGLSVVGDYQYQYSDLFWLVQLSFAAIAVLGFCVQPKKPLPKLFHYIAAPVVGIALTAVLLFVQTDRMFDTFGGYRYLFTPTVYYERNGSVVSFLSTLRYLNVKKPAGYDKKTVAQTAADYPGEPDSADDLPNVIVIMNEAFSDLRPLGPFTTNLPVTPFIDSLTENTRKGDLYVSVKGGNTANTEFEFLTGDSMAFLPSGSIPYQQYVKEDIPTLATHLKSLGYTAEAIHPYYASGWFRNSVYPHLGFDTATFLEDLRPLYTSQVLRSYYSDRALFDTVTKMVDGREDHSAPAFVFAVTMQNHGSYDEEFANFRPDVTVDGLEEYKRISAYLSLIRKTDQAFENLVNHYAASDEKTVILMFGDHQPNDSVIYKLLDQNGIAATTENLDAENRYITPYVLWANYDIGEAEAKDVSANYLSAVLCRTAGIPMDGYQEYLLDLCEDYPVVSARSVIRADGTHLTTEETSQALSDPASPLTRYRMMAYAHLFDKSGRPTEFYD